MDSRNAIQTPNHGHRGMHARQGSPEALSRFLVGSSWEHLDLIRPGGRFDTVADRLEANVASSFGKAIERRDSTPLGVASATQYPDH